MLEIKDLRASAGDKEILQGINLTVKPGEVHAVMGPNGSGKSTLAQVLAGHPAYEVTGGSVTYEGQDLLDLEPEERAQAGVFLAFQYPVEIPGVTNAYFLRAAYNEIRKAKGLEEIDSMDFIDLLEEKLKVVEWGPEIMSRAVNSGFSGGEKKRNEILQLAVLEPKLAILDETDSGLDIDALRIVAAGVNRLRGPDRSFIVVTHYQRLLNYIVPDYVHVLSNGRIAMSGGKELALELEAKGYEWVEAASPAGAGRRAAGERGRPAGPRDPVERRHCRRGRGALAGAGAPGRGRPVRGRRVPGQPGRRVALHPGRSDRPTVLAPVAGRRPAAPGRAARSVRLRAPGVEHAGLRQRQLQRGAVPGVRAAARCSRGQPRRGAPDRRLPAAGPSGSPRPDRGQPLHCAQHRGLPRRRAGACAGRTRSRPAGAPDLRDHPRRRRHRDRTRAT